MTATSTISSPTTTTSVTPPATMFFAKFPAGCALLSAAARAEDLRQSIFSRRIHLPSSQLTVRISLGLALSTDFPKCDVEELLHHADMALYAAKAAGRNCVRIAQPESVDSKSDLPDVVPDPGITTARALIAAATRSRNPISIFFLAFVPSFAASSNWSPVLASLSTTPAARRHFRSPKTNKDS
jgi:Diguanylate cyclase, GGDEF domain